MSLNISPVVATRAYTAPCYPSPPTAERLPQYAPYQRWWRAHSCRHRRQLPAGGSRQAARTRAGVFRGARAQGGRDAARLLLPASTVRCHYAGGSFYLSACVTHHQRTYLWCIHALLPSFSHVFLRDARAYHAGHTMYIPATRTPHAATLRRAANGRAVILSHETATPPRLLQHPCLEQTLRWTVHCWTWTAAGRLHHLFACRLAHLAILCHRRCRFLDIPSLSWCGYSLYLFSSTHSRRLTHLP